MIFSENRCPLFRIMLQGVKLIVPVQGHPAVVTGINLMPALSPWLDAVFQHQSKACIGKLAWYRPAHRAEGGPSSGMP